jgi:hypothetical protein
MANLGALTYALKKGRPDLLLGNADSMEETELESDNGEPAR